MPTPTYMPLASTTLSGTAASVTFSGINQTYKDLVLLASPVGTGGGFYMQVMINGSTSNYSSTATRYSGAVSTSSMEGNARLDNTWTDYGDGSFLHLNFMDYSDSTKHKNILYRAGNAKSNSVMGFIKLASTSAVTSITIENTGASFTAGAKFALYGIAA